MLRFARVALAAFFLAGFCAGCKSHSPSQYVSPRITGRVLDLTSETPISGVQVRRLTSEDEYRPLDAPKGGQRMANTPNACTGADGRFVLESQRDLAVFRKIHWYSVTLSLAHPAYTRLLTNYTLVNVTNSPNGEPVVNAGDIRLTPRAN